MALLEQRRSGPPRYLTCLISGREPCRWRHNSRIVVDVDQRMLQMCPQEIGAEPATYEIVREPLSLSVCGNAAGQPIVLIKEAVERVCYSSAHER